MSKEEPSQKKILYAALAALIGCAAGSYALYNAWASQPANTGPTELTLHPERQQEIMAERRADRIQEKLNLSDEQAAQMEEIMRGMGEEMRRMGPPPAGGGIREMMARRRGHMQQMDEKVRAILDDEQFEKYQAEKKKRMQAMGGMRQMFGGRPMNDQH